MRSATQVIGCDMSYFYPNCLCDNTSTEYAKCFKQLTYLISRLHESEAARYSHM